MVKKIHVGHNTDSNGLKVVVCWRISGVNVIILNWERGLNPIHYLATESNGNDYMSTL